ncbi:hypothetical protein AHAS_Ahas02G0172900 [Arachis hypogaea]
MDEIEQTVKVVRGRILEEDLRTLQEDFTAKEVKETLSQMHATKARGLDTDDEAYLARRWSAFARILNVQADDVVSIGCRYENDSNMMCQRTRIA